ncbi:hypothetical protein REISMN_08595 (plasmid) [Rickettsia tamurae subsp. buchneri]|uniref:Uncharacterized protein n=1 Tax=Rickettsia tamurae subsp. buchneri TaxID=1462938 RepID=A0A8E0WKD2_9RICK|nr:hypothetical protein REISMN_08595 [Rickettsia tamurae subsp. buchneri]
MIGKVAKGLEITKADCMEHEVYIISGKIIM